MKEIEITAIRTGDTGLVQTKKGFLQKAIQYFQSMKSEGGNYNHALMFWWNYEVLMVIEAIETGIAITPFTDYLNNPKKYELLVLRPIFDIDGSEYGKYMLPYCGRTRYAFLNLLVFQPIKFITKKWIGGEITNTKRFICGEWCAYVYNHFTGMFPEPQKYAPSDLFDSTHFEHFKIIKR